MLRWRIFVGNKAGKVGAASGCAASGMVTGKLILCTATCEGSPLGGPGSCSMQNELQLNEMTPRTGFSSLFIARLAAGSW